MSHYEKYVGLINEFVALLREENSPEERMEHVKYVVDEVLKRLLDAKLLSVDKSCERCR